MDVVTASRNIVRYVTKRFIWLQQRVQQGVWVRVEREHICRQIAGCDSAAAGGLTILENHGEVQMGRILVVVISGVDDIINGG